MIRNAISTSRFAIDTLSGAILLRSQHWKLRFPVAQHMRLHTGEFADLADLEEQFFGNGYSGTAHYLKGLVGKFELAVQSAGKVFGRLSVILPATDNVVMLLGRL